MSELSFIIVAGGTGKRMKYKIPKQFIEIKDKPILLHTLEKVSLYLKPSQIIVVLPESFINYWTKIIKEKVVKIKHEIVEGGKERYYSVKKGLEKIKKTEIVAIHDGVRPLVTKSFLIKLYKEAIKKGSAVPYYEVYDTLIKISNKEIEYKNRNNYLCIQTPQFYKYEILKEAYNLPYDSLITDDSQLVTKAGFKINLVKGTKYNIKITTREDLKIVNLMLK